MNNQEKQRIKEEEIFREEVRKSLTSTEKKDWTKSINSPLFIWFISTIVLGLFSYYFQQNKIKNEAMFQIEYSIEKIDTELENRISQFWTNLKPFIDTKFEYSRDYTFTNQIDSVQFVTYWNCFKNAPALNPKLSSNIYKEYVNRNTISLIIEQIHNLEKQQDLKLETRNSGRFFTYSKKKLSSQDSLVINQIYKMRNAINYISSDKILFGKFDTIKPSQIWQPFKENVIIRRWNKYFPYTNTLLNWHPSVSDL